MMLSKLFERLAITGYRLPSGTGSSTISHTFPTKETTTFANAEFRKSITKTTAAKETLPYLESWSARSRQHVNFRATPFLQVSEKQKGPTYHCLPVC